MELQSPATDVNRIAMHTPESHLAVLHSALNALQEMDAATWQDAVPHFRHHRFAAAAHVFRAGEVVNELYFITSGLARYYYLSPTGKEFNKSFSTTGQVLSSISSLVTAAPAPFFVQALTACDCLSISYQDLLVLAETHREWNRLCMRLLEMLAIKKERRESDLLLLSAEQRYARFLRDHAHISDAIPNYHIASYLGITEQALSRIRRRLGLTRVNASAGS